MKSLKRRLLSLFLAMVMVLSLAPGALAEDPGVPNGATWVKAPDKNLCTSDHQSITYKKTEATCKNACSEVWTCGTCGGTVTNPIDKLTTHTPITNPNKPEDYDSSETGVHYVKCSVCGTKTGNSITCTYNQENNTKCVCGRENPNTTVATTKISLNLTEKSIAVGEKFSLQATIEPSNASNKNVTWGTDAPNIATVNQNGEVTGVAAGSAEITATQGSFTAKCNVTVTAAAPTYVVDITSDTDSVAKGKTLQLTATVKQNGNALQAQPTITWGSSVTKTASVTQNGLVTGEETGSTKITAICTIGGQTYRGEKTINVTNPFVIRTTDDTTLTAWGQKITLIPYYNNVRYTEDVEWTLTNRNYFDSTVSGSTYIVEPENASKTPQTATATATAFIDGKEYTASIVLSLKFSAEITLTATVSSDYYFGEVSDKGSYSVEDQLLRAIPSGHTLDYIRFSNVTTNYGDLDGITRNEKIYDDDIEDILFVPTKKGDAVFNFTAYTYSKSSNDLTERDGILTITVTDASDSSGDVVFYGDVGEDVSLDSGSFEDFWDDEYPNGELEYVTFSVSGGTLRDADGKTVGSKKCYVRAGRNEIELDEVYFEPNSTNKKTAKTVSFSFTAYGENERGTNKEASGRVSIVYTAENPDDITYTSGSNGTVSLKASDFTAAYKEVISGSVPSNLTIVFQSVPRNGTLTYNDSSKKNAKDVKLTSSNIKKYSFTTKSSGSNQLNDVVYSGTSGTDTIDYIAYSGSTIKFKGSVVFNGKGAIPQDVVVYYASTAGQPARFSQNDFTTANSAMSKAAKIRFVTPANGTLYLNGSTSAAGIDIAPALLYSVTYQPKAGFNGTDKVVFAAYDASNNLVANGSVNITVAGNPTTSTTPGGTTNPGGVTDVSQFTDVSGNAWYRANLATLVSKGVISGRGDGKFDPKGTVTYGEALKMVLESCGYTAAVGTGSQWAINYKNLAVSKGWISSSVDLNAAISRNATAELAAKVLGVAPVTSGSPFGDEANAYAVALYYTTPQIFVGTTNPNGGKPLFENSKPLLREQVCAVICRVSDYHTQHTTNVMPDGV